jgi:integrase
MSDRWGPVRLGNEIGRVRSVFKYGYAAGLIENEVRYGDQFKKPSASVLRRERAKRGEKMLEAAELRTLIDSASVPLKAFVLLGINAGFGNHDVACLPKSALDLDGGWVNYPRPKTGIPRRVPLWPETIASLRDALAAQPEPQQECDEDLVFLDKQGRAWLDKKGIAHPITGAVIRLMDAANVRREKLGFYTLRHVFRTIADGSRDQPAINHIMGHADGSMAAVYRERIEDSRLRAVTEHVRKWLYGEPVGRKPKSMVRRKTETSDPSDPSAPRSVVRKAKTKAKGSRPALRLFAG